MDDARVDFGSDEDNLDHHLYWNHFVHFQMFDEYGARTDLTAVEQCRHCWNNNTDIVWFASAIPNDANGREVLGKWECRKVNLISGTCDRGRLMFQERLTRTISGAAGFAIVCHEVGHAAGFDHFDDGCMPATLNRDAPFTNVLSNHMITHINQQY